MKISLDWIKDFTQLPEKDADSLATRLTLGCCEVEDVETQGLFWEQIKVAEILEIEAHPEADKLNLVTFDYGAKQTKKVVCGASNVRKGLKTPYAPTGVLLPNGLFLEPKKIRGFLSEGMLCSQEELCLADSSEGIMELDPSLEVGTAMKDVLNKNTDTVLDIDNKSLTHRPDLWGHYGMAREFAALYEMKLEKPFSPKWMQKMQSLQTDQASPVKVSVEKDCAALAYYGLSLDGVEVESSPDWMQNRLRAVGLRPINNIVDISNYVMIELGMPLHIFDRQEIKGGQVHIKALSENTSFQTLDEVERELLPGDTIISDNEAPLVLAGIMGGLKSGVKDTTQEIFIEVANWQAAPIRRTSTRIGLRTDSSQRYEKSLDSLLCERTLWRTVELICELCPKAKVIGKIEYDGEDLTKIPDLKLSLGKKKLQKVLGVELSDLRVKAIFESLDFGIEDKGESFEIHVPSFRATKDIEGQADLIEEVGRVVGYDNIDPVSPALDISPVSLTNSQKLQRQTRDFMVYNAHAYEVMTYPMLGQKNLEKCSWPQMNDELVLVNALSRDQDRMRPSLLPSLLEACALNAKQRERFHLFEWGRSYQPSSKSFCEEHTQVALCMYHPEKSLFKELANTAERYMRALNLPGDICERNPKFKNQVIDEQWNGIHPYEFFNVRLMGKMQGAIFSIHPLVMRDLKMKGHLSVMLMDLTQVEMKAPKDKTKYRPLPKFPGSNFDCTIVTKKGEPVAKVLESLKSFKEKELQEVKVADVFELDKDLKSVTLRASFLDPEKTLSGDFLTQAGDKMVATLEKAGYPLKS
jgi:phenylalanyl-tRNA synthetase beta chain